MTFEEELHKEIDSWDEATVFKMQVEEAILNIYKKDKQRVKETIIKALKDTSYVSKNELAGVLFKELELGDEE